MRTIKNYIKILFLAGVLANFSACDDFSFPVDDAYDRLFSPVTFESETPQATQIAITFSKVGDATAYIFEFAEDSLQFNNIVRTEEKTVADLQYAEGTVSKYTVIFGQLKGDTRYSVRIKAVTSEGTPESKWVTLTFNTKGEQIFGAIAGTEKTDKSVVLHWTAGDVPVTHITLVPAIGDHITVQLTAEDVVASFKKIEGLESGTVYSAMIYNGENKRGELTFRTNESIPATGVVYYLQGGEDIVAYLQSLTDSDITLVMPAGTSYVASWTNLESIAQTTLTLNDNITSITFWGLEGGDKAKLNFTSFKPGAAINKIKFKNIEVHGNLSTADYVLNESATRSIAEINFEDCVIHTFRGVVRLQNAANSSVIDKVSINNCIFNNIGGYGVVHTQNTSAVVTDVAITNSTFNTITDAFIYLSTKSNSVIVSECTFYNCLGNGRYIFNLNNNVANIPTTLKLENCIIGKFYYTTAEPDPTFSARASNPKILESFALGTYKTTDFVVNTGYPLSGASEYEKSSVDLFVSPSTGDFTIKDDSFAGKETSGDPRWR